MPYVEQHLRPDLDCVIDEMIHKKIKANGDLNYILFKYCKYHVPRNYNSVKNFIGELSECGAEIRRKILADYEDGKIITNGDV